MGCGKACGHFHFASLLHLIVGRCWHLQGQPHRGGCGVERWASLPEGGPGWTWRDWEGPGGSFRGGAEDRWVLTVASVLLKFPGG